MRQPQLSDMSAAGMVQTNWKFVETLLKECKTKVRPFVWFCVCVCEREREREREEYVCMYVCVCVCVCVHMRERIIAVTL